MHPRLSEFPEDLAPVTITAAHVNVDAFTTLVANVHKKRQETKIKLEKMQEARHSRVKTDSPRHFKMDSPLADPPFVPHNTARGGRKICELCGCKFLRVGTSWDGKGKIVECRNRTCLATVEELPDHTPLPVGYMFNVDDDNRGWFNLDLNRTYYPKKHFDADFNFSNKKIRSDVDHLGNLRIPCPGQEDLVEML